jgi:hypothetical protein
MNKISLSHNNIQNQQDSSWNDDPFDLKGAFAGVANMNHTTNLRDYAEALVANYAKYVDDQYELFLSNLPGDEQNEVARLFIEASDREVNECVYGNDFSIESDYTCALLAMLRDDCVDTRENFAQVTRKNILTYYHKSIQDVLDTACNSYFHLVNNESSNHAHYDLEHDGNCGSKF